MIKYINGFYCGADNESPKEIGQVKNAVITAVNTGYPFRGNAEDMAKNVISHIINEKNSDVGLFPVIIESYCGTDRHGEYVTKVVFQVVILH